MENVRSILAGAPPSRDSLRFPVVWSESLKDQLRRVAAGEVAGRSPVDGILSRLLLHCADGEFEIAETGILDVVRARLETLSSDGETFISLLNALFVVQRLDLVGALLHDRFTFPGKMEVGLVDHGIGKGLMQWTISPVGLHSFVFDVASLRTDSTRNEMLNFYWAFPLFANYAAKRGEVTGTVLLNRNDIGHKPGLAYCDNRPDFFLIPDAGFVSSRGYEWCRQVYDKNRIAWHERRPVAFWRGATTGMKPGPRDWRALERVKLCEIARAHADTGLFDVGLSGLTQVPDPDVAKEIMDSGLILGRVAWEDWGNYRYLIIIDGNSSPYSNLIQALMTGSAVLRVESSRALRQWFYSDLIPWHNYIPIAPDMSDLLDKVKWLRQNDAYAHQVGENGRLLALSMTIERELNRSVSEISSAFRYFCEPSAVVLPYGMQPPLTVAAHSLGNVPTVASEPIPPNVPLSHTSELRSTSVVSEDSHVIGANPQSDHRASVNTISSFSPSCGYVDSGSAGFSETPKRSEPSNEEPTVAAGHVSVQVRAVAASLRANRIWQIASGCQATNWAFQPDQRHDGRLIAGQATTPQGTGEKRELFGDKPLVGPRDIVLIDGSRTFADISRDLNNAILHSHRQSVIVIVDILPNEVYSTAKDRKTADRTRIFDHIPPGRWHGDAFKTLFYLNDFWPNINYRTIDCDGRHLTIAWQVVGMGRAPAFGNLEKIDRLTYFDLKDHPEVIRHASEDEVVALYLNEIAMVNGPSH